MKIAGGNRILFLLLIALVLASCYKRILMSKRDIRKYYRHKTIRPRFGNEMVEGRAIHYAETGSDTLPLVLFIHGAPGAWYGYIHYLDDTTLLKQVHMISVDRPGYGESGYGKPVVSIAEQARLLFPIIRKHANGRPVIIVGRSYGGPIAAKMAIDHPDSVSALVLIAPALDPAHEKFWWFNKPARSKIVRALMPRAFSVSTDEKYAHVAELEKLFPYWETLHTPLTLLQGTNDHIVDTANFSFARCRLDQPGNCFISLPGQSHFIATERPDLVRNEILRYVAELKQH